MINIRLISELLTNAKCFINRWQFKSIITYTTFIAFIVKALTIDAFIHCTIHLSCGKIQEITTFESFINILVEMVQSLVCQYQSRRVFTCGYIFGTKHGVEGEGEEIMGWRGGEGKKIMEWTGWGRRSWGGRKGKKLSIMPPIVTEYLLIKFVHNICYVLGKCDIFAFCFLVKVHSHPHLPLPLEEVPNACDVRQCPRALPVLQAKDICRR